MKLPHSVATLGAAFRPMGRPDKGSIAYSDRPVKKWRRSCYLLILLRIRFLLQEAKGTPDLAGECVVCAFTGLPGQLSSLDEAHALELLRTAQPVTNVSPTEWEAAGAGERANTNCRGPG